MEFGTTELPTEIAKKQDIRQREQLVKIGLKETFYYLFCTNIYKKPAGAITVSLLFDAKNQPIARGLSILSPKDNMVKAKARALARGRALRAYSKKVTGSPIKLMRDTTVNVAMIEAYNTFKNKSTYLPELTDYEKKLVENNKKK